MPRTPASQPATNDPSLSDIIEAMAEGLLVTDGEGQMLWFNSAALDMIGLNDEQLLKRAPPHPDWRLLHEDGSPVSYEDRPGARALRSGKPVHDHLLEVCKADGGHAWIAVYSEPLFHPGETAPYAVVTTIRDVTQRRMMSLQLAASERQYRSIVETAQEGIWVLDANRHTTFVNAHMAEMLGYRPAEMMGRSNFDFMDEDMAVEVRAAWQKHVEGDTGSHEVRYRHRDGHDVWLLIAANPLYDEAGQFHGALGMVTDISARKQTLAQLSTSEARFRAIFNTLHEGLVIQDMESGQFLAANDRFCELYGYSQEELDVLSVSDLCAGTPPWTAGEAMKFAVDAREHGQVTFEFRARRKNGTLFWVEITLIHTVLEQSEHMLVAVQDITDRKAIARELRASEARYRTLADSAPVGIYRGAADGRVTYCNAKAAELAGIDRDALGDFRWIESVHPEERDRVREHFKQTLSQNEAFRDEHRLLHADGRLVWVISTAVPEFDDRGEVTHYVGTITDISEQKRIEAEMRYRANYDPLTGLPNRDLATERLEQAIRQARREDSKIGVLFIDLDHFKEVNDTRGHALGDKLLQGAATRLRACVRDNDTVARQGGDEFVILLNGVEHATDCAVVAEKTIEALCEPFLLDGHEEHIGASVGITIYPNDGDDVLSLFRNADLAMYRAKGRGRNTYDFFELEMTEAAMERRGLESDLRGALMRGEFELHYQPIIDLHSSELKCVEALLRWNHPRRGSVPPDEFIPVAEELGLIREIGVWVLTEGCRQLQQWHRQGREICLALNVSVRQIPDGLSIDTLRDTAKRFDIEPSHLVLEITESVLMADLPKTHQWLREARELGMELSLDDFGTGYSSLGYLKRFPIRYLKIDKEFVRDMHSNRADCALIEAILAMARALELEVVAEGVEIPEQYQMLRKLDCDFAQGYLLAHPVPASDFDAALEQLAATLAAAQ